MYVHQDSWIEREGKIKSPVIRVSIQTNSFDKNIFFIKRRGAQGLCLAAPPHTVLLGLGYIADTVYRKRDIAVDKIAALRTDADDRRRVKNNDRYSECKAYEFVCSCECVQEIAAGSTVSVLQEIDKQRLGET